MKPHFLTKVQKTRNELCWVCRVHTFRTDGSKRTNTRSKAWSWAIPTKKVTVTFLVEPFRAYPPASEQKRKSRSSSKFSILKTPWGSSWCKVVVATSRRRRRRWRKLPNNTAKPYVRWQLRTCQAGGPPAAEAARSTPKTIRGRKVESSVRSNAGRLSIQASLGRVPQSMGVARIAIRGTSDHKSSFTNFTHKGTLYSLVWD